MGEGKATAKTLTWRRLFIGDSSRGRILSIQPSRRLKVPLKKNSIILVDGRLGEDEQFVASDIQEPTTKDSVQKVSTPSSTITPTTPVTPSITPTTPPITPTTPVTPVTPVEHTSSSKVELKSSKELGVDVGVKGVAVEKRTPTVEVVKTPSTETSKEEVSKTEDDARQMCLSLLRVAGEMRMKADPLQNNIAKMRSSLS